MTQGASASAYHTPGAADRSTAFLLRRHWRWLIPGLVIAMAVAAFSLRNSKEFASASTAVLVDWNHAPYMLDVAQPLGPLTERAGVFARLGPSPALVNRIAAGAGVDPSQVTASGPYKPGAPVTEREPSPERRGTQLAAERDDYRLRFDSESQQGIPIVSIFSQAPTVEGANRLADSAADAFKDYVADLQREADVPASQRIRLQIMGRADGAIVNPGTDAEVAGLRFFGVLLAWVLVVVGVARFGAGVHLGAPEPLGQSGTSMPELRR